MQLRGVFRIYVWGLDSTRLDWTDWARVGKFCEHSCETICAILISYLKIYAPPSLFCAFLPPPPNLMVALKNCALHSEEKSLWSDFNWGTRSKSTNMSALNQALRNMIFPKQRSANLSFYQWLLINKRLPNQCLCLMGTPFVFNIGQILNFK